MRGPRAVLANRSGLEQGRRLERLDRTMRQENGLLRLHLLSRIPAAPGSQLGRVLRLAVASVASIGGAVIMRSWASSIPTALWIPAGLLGLSALLLHHREVGSQLVARSVWWANFVLGTLISLLGSGHERSLGLLLATATGAALLAMGRMGLEEQEASAFRPVAFRNTLVFGMVMAVADAQALLLFGALKIEEKGRSGVLGWRLESALLLASAALVMVSILGLYRLRVWGLLLGALSAAVIGALALADVYDLGSPLNWGLALTSAAQLLLPIPVVVAIARRRAPEPSRSASRLAHAAPVALILALLGASAFRVCVLGDPLFR
jgi:hypothetical protein